MTEGIADGTASLAKLVSGFYTDKLRRRKAIAVTGTLVVALGTAAFGFVTAPWQAVAARTGAWLGRGVRTPVRKALLAAAVTPQTYGRAFGFDRMMDSFGALIGPATALLLLNLFSHNYRPIFFCTLIPGLASAAAIGFLVREKRRAPVAHITFAERLHALPANYRRFLVGVSCFGAGDFAHSMLILFASQKLAPAFGVAGATTIAVSFYILHNFLASMFSYISGALADRFRKNILLAISYLLAAIMAFALVLLPATILTIALFFTLAGIYFGMQETLEDSLAAELVIETHHGTAFGVLASLNGLGDLVSSAVVGALWSAFGTVLAFSYSAVLFLAGAIIVALWLSHPPPGNVRAHGST